MPNAQLNSDFKTKTHVDALSCDEPLKITKYFGVSDERLKKAIR